MLLLKRIKARAQRRVRVGKSRALNLDWHAESARAHPYLITEPLVKRLSHWKKKILPPCTDSDRVLF